MTKARDIPVEHFIFAAIVLSVFTWFTATALLRGEIRMGRPGFAKTITRADNPAEYWRATGGFLVITGFGWFAVGLNGYRKMKKRNPNTNLEPISGSQ